MRVLLVALLAFLLIGAGAQAHHKPWHEKGPKAPPPAEPEPDPDPPPPEPDPDPPPPDDGIATDCSVDVTSQLQALIESAPVTDLVAGGCYRIEGTLEFVGRSLQINGNGATLRSFNPPAAQRAISRFWNSTVAIRDLSIVGSYANGGTHSPELQYAHAVDLRGTHGTVERVHVRDLSGDCVYFGLGSGRSSGAVRDSTCRAIGRNAVSVVAGDDIRVERITTDQVGYIAFDVEPNPGPGNGSARVVFDSNVIGSYVIRAYAVLGQAPISDQSFTNNRITAPQGLKLETADWGYRPAGLTINGNVAERQAAPPAMILNDLDGVTVVGNTVPIDGGTMAQVRRSCGVVVHSNQYPGGVHEFTHTNPAC